MKWHFKALLLFSTLGLVVGCGSKNIDSTPLQKRAEELIKTPNIRVVIGSKSTGGDTYEIASLVCQRLRKVLGKNVKVDAVGSSNAFDAIDRVKNGSTIMIFHDQSYLGYLYGTAGYYDIFKYFKIGPTLAINPGTAFATTKNSKFKTINDVINAIGKGEKVRIAIQAGGVSEIGFTQIQNAVYLKYPNMVENLIPVYTGSQADKNQQLFDGQADVIHASVQANEQFTHLPANDQKAMKFLWITAKKSTLKALNKNGYGKTPRSELMKHAEPNVVVPLDKKRNSTFDKEFFMIYNSNMNHEIVKLYNDALAEVFKSKEFNKKLKNAFFVPDFRTSEDSLNFLEEKSGIYEKIINREGSSKKSNADFNQSHLFFPKIMGWILLLLFLIILIKELPKKIRNYKSGKRFKFFNEGYDKVKLFGSIILIIG
jgi:tripartite-type tricarboxylate transporter receptor subunit TctC